MSMKTLTTYMKEKKNPLIPPAEESTQDVIITVKQNKIPDSLTVKGSIWERL